MMADLFLRAANEVDMLAALTVAGLTDAPITVDIIGQDPARVVGIDAEGGPILAVMPGYHVNIYPTVELSPEQAAALSGVTIAPPANPYRVRFD